MPFLKFSRDKRGYEIFSLVEPITGRHGKTRPRVLFWFRTPPQVKVGREPFTDEVRRAIETQNPGLRFDWARLMATPIPAPDVEHWRERRRAERAARQAAREPDEADSAPTEPAEMVEAGAAVPADSTVSTSESQERAPTAAPGSGLEPPAGGRRRRRRRGRRKPHPQADTTPGPTAPNVTGPPTDEV